jgi:copper(I)-binding protein
MLRLAALFLLLPIAAFAQANRITIENAWSRPALAGRVGVVYLTMKDNGRPDTLTGASSPVAVSAELHESFSDNGVSKMRPVGPIQVAPGKPVTLAPGGLHLMLMGLKQPLKMGETFPVMLTFAKAGEVTANVKVEKPGAGRHDVRQAPHH